jgi:phospholipid-binding lipoprotein MlaA
MPEMNRTLLALAALALAGPVLVAPAAAQTPAPPPAAEVAQASPDETSSSALRDPWEGFNRKVFGFNNAIDRAILEPVAKGYRAVTPRVARTGVTNFFDNLRAPVTVANDLLQGAPKRAAVTLGRFGLNSTIGIGGLIDVGSSVGLEPHREDFGQTLGVWGAGPGNYLMLPLIGPSSLRDVTGTVVDNAFSPLTYLNDAEDLRVGLAALSAISAREGAIEEVDALRANSADPYVSLRSIYGQSRASAIRNGAQDVKDLPDFGGPP